MRRDCGRKRAKTRERVTETETANTNRQRTNQKERALERKAFSPDNYMKPSAHLG